MSLSGTVFDSEFQMAVTLLRQLRWPLESSSEWTVVETRGGVCKGPFTLCAAVESCALLQMVRPYVKNFAQIETCSICACGVLRINVNPRAG